MIPHIPKQLVALGLLAAAACADAQPLLTAYTASNAGNPGAAPGVDLVRHTIGSPLATCNDGTPALAYVQAGVGAAANNWIIFLEGGGSCGNGQECMDRWQSYQTAYGLQKMSTRIPRATWDAWYPPGGPGAGPPTGWTLQGADYAMPAGIVGSGILSTAPANPFANWTKVYANYCSSDTWTGRQQSVPLSAINRRGGAGVAYTIHFHGAHIFDGLIADLRTGVAPCMGPGGFNCQALPSLNVANKVFLAGSSAGGVGVLHNVDLLRARQQLVNPATQVRAIIDGASVPPSQSLPWPAVATAAQPYTSYQQMIDARWNGTYMPLWQARVDASCLAENAAVPSRCADPAHVLRHHLTSPFFVRQDQQDSLIVTDVWRPFFPAPPYPALTAELDLSTRTVAHLGELSNMIALLTPRYVNELATIAADPQWLAPTLFGHRCGNHTGLTGGVTYYNQELPLGGVLLDLADALGIWAAAAPAGIGGPPATLMVAPVGAGPIAGAPCT
jgi:hypothetical protein